jgi:ABC-type transport system involved in multi-copper enzyme maturation permease subunit
VQIPPLIERELRTALRKRKAASARFWTGAAAVGATLLICLAGSAGLRHTSQTLFSILLVISCLTAVFETVHSSIDLLSLERRNDTLGLLFLSGLNVAEVFLGKLTGALLVQLSRVFALLPCFAVSFLMGGVPGTTLIATAVLIVNLMLLALAVSLLASSLTKEEGTAMALATGLGLVIGLASPAVYYGSLLTPGTTAGKGWLLFSPLYGVEIVWKFFATASAREFWWNSSVTLGYTGVCLGLAAWIVKCTWRETEIPLSLKHWWPAAGRAWDRWSGRDCVSDRSWLACNPYAWLALRDRRPVQLGWIGLGLIATAWAILFAFWPKRSGLVFSGVMVALLTNAIVGWLMALAAATRMAEDRRSGALELLLTAPLSPEQILEGQRQALRTGFHPLLWCLLVVNAIWAGAAIPLRDWNGLALVVYGEIWATMVCLVIVVARSQTIPRVMWAALNSARPLFSLTKVVSPPILLVVFGQVLVGVSQSGWPSNFLQGTEAELCVGSAVLILAMTGALCSGRSHGVSDRFKRELRAIAQEPVPEPSDPRFKKWDASKRFPEDEFELRLTRPLVLGDS